MEFLAYQEKGENAVGVCLTFNIIEEGENLEKVMNGVVEAANLHLRAVQKEDLSDDLLNRYAPEKYWDKYLAVLKELSKQRAGKDTKRQTVSTSSKKYTLDDILTKKTHRAAAIV